MRKLCRQDAGQEARGNRARQLDTPPAEGIWPSPGTLAQWQVRYRTGERGK